ncbi:hypothetical protein HYPSUDRAFT_198883 [Hypholoma sublateritium FD-334 SS-4]|uniref:Uncharacterized protein n=1 Tax=Hypholoma sublateritium (strain FD-334 SS-4) TaxID=945553 RepID=A0A0D2MRI1_HYPSF|nr:hypothetical protein HYPSUDRAFT_198883 [Hypholoma sublateritium FD-334 SS-4]
MAGSLSERPPPNQGAFASFDARAGSLPCSPTPPTSKNDATARVQPPRAPCLPSPLSDIPKSRHAACGSFDALVGVLLCYSAPPRPEPAAVTPAPAASTPSSCAPTTASSIRAAEPGWATHDPADPRSAPARGAASPVRATTLVQELFNATAPHGTCRTHREGGAGFFQRAHPSPLLDPSPLPRPSTSRGRRSPLPRTPRIPFAAPLDPISPPLGVAEPNGAGTVPARASMLARVPFPVSLAIPRSPNSETLPRHLRMLRCRFSRPSPSFSQLQRRRRSTPPRPIRDPTRRPRYLRELAYFTTVAPSAACETRNAK